MTVFAVSLSTLFFEVLLTRSFALTQWSHLSFMVITIALFGYSSGGVVIHIRERRLRNRSGGRNNLHTSDKALCLVTGCAVLLSWTAVNLIPFDSIQLPFRPIQILYLIGVFLCLSVPFFTAGMVTARSFATRPKKPGYVYAAAMTGSAAGAVLPIAAIPLLGYPGSIALAALTTAIPGFIGTSRRLRLGSGALACICVAAAFLPGLLSPQPSSYKALPKYLEHPDAHLQRSVETFSEKLDVFTGGGLHTAPGLSLTYRGRLPEQTALFVDNGSPYQLYSSSSQGGFTFVKSTTGWLPFLLLPEPDKVLVAVVGGGLAVPSALIAGAEAVEVLDGNRARAAEIAAHYGSSILVRPGSIRTSLAALKPRYDIAVLDHPGTANPGLIGINEDYVLTREGIKAVLGALNDEGIFSVSRRLQIPPSDSLKLFSTIFEALNARGVSTPEQHICMIRNWNTYTLIATMNPISESDKTLIRSFADSNGFDLVYYPGLNRSMANRYARRTEPIYFDGIAARLVELKEPGSTDHTYVEVRAAGDRKPYFNRFIRWRRFNDLYAATGGRSYVFYFSGEIIMLLVLATALVFSCGLILTPSLIGGRRAPKGWGPVILLFGILGIAYMLFEIAWIKRLTLLTSNPGVSFAVVLASLLTASGLGGLLSQRLQKRRLIQVYAVSAAAAALSGIGWVYLPPLLLPLPTVAVTTVVLTCIIAPGIVLGVPLSLTMRALEADASVRVFGWALNGTTSVLTGTAAALVALYLGIDSLLWLSAGFYGCAALIAFLFTRRTSS